MEAVCLLLGAKFVFLCILLHIFTDAFLIACVNCTNLFHYSLLLLMFAILLMLTYKVLTTSQPTYLSKLVTAQFPRSTRSSSVVTISRPPTSSSLEIADRSFQHTAPRLWNKLPHSSREPHPHPGLLPCHYSTQVGSTLSSPPLSPSITPSFFSL